MNMSKIFNTIPAMIALVLVLAMTGCLKDSDYSNNRIGTKNTQNQNFVEVHLTTSDNSNIVARAYDLLDHDTTVTKLIPINLTSGPASSDVTVSFELLDTVKSAAVKSLIVDDQDVLVDTSVFKIMNPGMKVTIPAGSQTGYISVKFKPSTLIGTTYVFAVRLTSVTNNYTISNLSDGIVTVSIRNQWDGSYMMKGWVLRAGDAARTGNFSGVEWKLGTVGKSAVAFWQPQIWADGSTVGGIGNWVLSIDDSNGPNNPMPVSVSDPTNPAVSSNPDYNNRYDPATKTFYISVYWGAGPSSRAAIDTLVYTGPY
jgi:hypothetical protein